MWEIVFLKNISICTSKVTIPEALTLVFPIPKSLPEDELNSKKDSWTRTRSQVPFSAPSKTQNESHRPRSRQHVSHQLHRHLLKSIPVHTLTCSGNFSDSSRLGYICDWGEMLLTNGKNRRGTKEVISPLCSVLPTENIVKGYSLDHCTLNILPPCRLFFNFSHILKS